MDQRWKCKTRNTQTAGRQHRLSAVFGFFFVVVVVCWFLVLLGFLFVCLFVLFFANNLSSVFYSIGLYFWFCVNASLIFVLLVL
jgi:Flp pilus assembly protein TadB